MNVFENSRFIWYTKEETEDSYGEFFQNFQVSSKKQVLCHLSVDGDYTLFVNGKYVQSNQYGDYEHYKIYDTLDLTSYVKEGANAFALLVWHIGVNSSRYKKAAAGAIFEVLQEGKLLLKSDESILSRESIAYQNGLKKSITGQLGLGFAYDLKKEDDWIRTGYGFHPSVEVTKSCTFYPRPNQKLQVGECIDEKLLSDCGNTYFLVDLQEEYYGLPTLRFYSEKEQKVTVTWGEHLADKKVRQKIGSRDFSFDLYAKKGENVYTNYMLRLGCRYMELHTEYPVKLQKLSMYRQFYPVKKIKATLELPLDQKIYDLSVNSLYLCMMEHYVDCIWREQCLYAFDSRNQMLFGYGAFENGNAEYVRSNLTLMRMDRRSDHLLSICYPCGVDLVIPSYSLHYFTACIEYYEHTKDLLFLQEVYPKLTELLGAFEKNVKRGLLQRFSGSYCWNFYDWSPYLSGDLGKTEKEYPDAVLNLLFISALESYQTISRILQREFPYKELLGQLKTECKKQFFHKEDGYFSLLTSEKIYCSFVNALAVQLHLTTEEESRKICKAITEDQLVPCSIGMRPFIYDALLLTDAKKYKDFILTEMRKTYGKMVEEGASATYETEKGESDFGNAGSLCHGWTAVPAYYYRKFSMVKDEQ